MIEKLISVLCILECASVEKLVSNLYLLMGGLNPPLAGHNLCYACVGT